jgi:hypothetical protein
VHLPGNSNGTIVSPNPTKTTFGQPPCQNHEVDRTALPMGIDRDSTHQKNAIGGWTTQTKLAKWLAIYAVFSMKDYSPACRNHLSYLILRSIIDE